MAKIARDMKIKDEEVQIWNARLVRSHRSKLTQIRRWKKIKAFFKGDYFNEFEAVDKVSANWILAAVRQQASQLYFQNPLMNFTPKTVPGIHVAAVGEALMTREREIMGAEFEERKALVHGLKYGTGILKHAYNAEYDPEMPLADTRKVVDDTGGSDFNSMDAAHEDLTVQQGPLVEHNTNVARGHPNKRAIEPWNFLVDPEALTYEEARWVAHRFQRPWIQAKRDSRWDDEAREELQPTGRSAHWESAPGDMNEADWDWRNDPHAVDSSLTTFYEIWDKTTARTIVIAAGAEKPMMVKPYPYLGKAGPYEILTFIPDDDSFWGIPWADTFSDQVLALNKLRTTMMDHLERWGATKGAYRRNSIDQADAERFANAKTGQMVEINSTEDIDKIFKVFPHIQISGDAWKLQDLFQNDMTLISGVSENQQGGSARGGKGSKTATEANNIAQQAAVRTGDMRYLNERFIAGSTRKDFSLLRQFWTGQEIVQITGTDGQIWDSIVNKDVLDGRYGEFDVGIEPGSTERVDRAGRMRQHIELMRELTQMIPWLQQQGQTINLPELVKGILLNSEIIKDPNKILMPMPQQPQAPQQGQQGAAGAPGGPALQIGQGAPQPGLTNVSGLDQVLGVGDTFEGGRQLSEAFG